MDLGGPGTASDPLGLFCARLKRLQTQSGIKQTHLLGAAGLKRSQVSDILNGKIERPPEWGVTIAIVRACLEHAKAASRLVPPDLSDEADWQRRYFDLEQDLDTETRAKPRREEPAGRLLAEVTDPFALEVHRPVESDAPQPGLPALPVYVAREHDAELERVVVAAAQGESGIAVLVGGSSTGKTRACWEALGLLRRRAGRWRLWHPIDPTRPEAALRELPSIGQGTVVWLNEAQFYLDAGANGLEERIAAGLRELLRDPARAPVLVLATLWPEFWDRLTTRPAADGPDLHAQARELLAGRDIAVPSAFTSAQLPLLAAAGDPRLALAAEAAEDGRVIQFLAGVPELMARHRNAPSAAKVVIDAAIDARRLGMGIALSRAFLEAAAPWYLADTDWDGLPEDWLEQALIYTTLPCKGIPGPLTRIRPRTASTPTLGPAYRVADYLDQHGRHTRRQRIPPAGFWQAAARFASPGDLPALAQAAEDRGLLWDAARLRKRAVAQGNCDEAVTLIRQLHSLHPRTADPDLARWAVGRVALDDPGAVARLLAALRETGAEKQIEELLARDPAAYVALNYPGGLAWLLDALLLMGAEGQAAVLLARGPAAHVTLDPIGAVVHLLDSLRKAGAVEQVAVLADRAISHVALDKPNAVTMLLDALRQAGAEEQAAALADRAVAHVAVDDPADLFHLLDGLRLVGAEEQAAALADRAVANVALDRPAVIIELLRNLQHLGAKEHADRLADRTVAYVARDVPSAITLLQLALGDMGAEERTAVLFARAPAKYAALDDPAFVARLLDALRKAGAEEQISALATPAVPYFTLERPDVVTLLSVLQVINPENRAAILLNNDLANRIALDDPGVVTALLVTLRKAGAEEQAAALLSRAPAALVTLSDPGRVARLLDVLREAGAVEQVDALLARNPAAHVTLHNPDAAGRLLFSMQAVGASEQAKALAARAAAHCVLSGTADQVGLLLKGMREVGASAQANTLADRLIPEGRFDLFRKLVDYQMRYRFGRKSDGTPASPWSSSDLD